MLEPQPLDLEPIRGALDLAERLAAKGHQDIAARLAGIAVEELGRELAKRDPVTASILESEAGLRALLPAPRERVLVERPQGGHAPVWRFARPS